MKRENAPWDFFNDSEVLKVEDQFSWKFEPPIHPQDPGPLVIDKITEAALNRYERIGPGYEIESVYVGMQTYNDIMKYLDSTALHHAPTLPSFKVATISLPTGPVSIKADPSVKEGCFLIIDNQ